MNFKSISFTAIIAFVLSFLTALISGAGFFISLLRGVILAVCFGGLAVGIHFLYSKFLSDDTADAQGADSGESNVAPIGNKVDITIDDEDLQEEEDTPHFVLNGKNQMLNKDDLNHQSETLDSPFSQTASPVQKTEAPSSQKSSPVVEKPLSTGGGNAAAPSNNGEPAFKPVSLARPADSEPDEFPPIENALGGVGSPLGSVTESDNLDELPEMVKTNSTRDDTVTDSEFAKGGKTTSRLSDPMFPDGSMAESKDSSLMAEAIRTILKKEE